MTHNNRVFIDVPGASSRALVAAENGENLKFVYGDLSG